MAKKLLNEAAIRRFQTLANVKPINEMYHKRDEDMMEADDMEMDMGDEAPMDDMDAAADMEDEAPEMDAGGDLELTDEEADAIIELGKKLEAAMGSEEPEMDMGDEAPMDDMEDEADAEEEIMEALRGINYVPSKNEIVSEVAKRVARRLKQAKLHEAKLNKALGKK